jgi:glycosyltransferase involved in cell wall biosynthesis
MLSDVEGGPVTIAEAMASGCLVFSTNIGVAKDILKDRYNGVLTDNSDYEDIYNKLEYYTKNRDEAIRICRNAYDYSRNNMLFKDTFQPLGDAYRRVLASITEYNLDSLNVELVNRTNEKVSWNFKA